MTGVILVSNSPSSAAPMIGLAATLLVGLVETWRTAERTAGSAKNWVSLERLQC